MVMLECCASIVCAAKADFNDDNDNRKNVSSVRNDCSKVFWVMCA